MSIQANAHWTNVTPVVTLRHFANPDGSTDFVSLEFTNAATGDRSSFFLADLDAVSNLIADIDLEIAQVEGNLARRAGF